MDVHPIKNGINRYWSIPKSKFTFFNCHQRCLQRSCSPSADSVDSGVPNHRSWRPRGCPMRPTRPEDCAMAPRWAWRRQRPWRPCCGGLDGCEDMWRLTCKLRGDKVIYVGWRQIPTERFAMDVYIYISICISAPLCGQWVASEQPKGCFRSNLTGALMGT